MSMSQRGGPKASSCLEILGGRELVLRLGRIFLLRVRRDRLPRRTAPSPCTRESLPPEPRRLGSARARKTLAPTARPWRAPARSSESSALHEQVQDVPTHVASRAEHDRRVPDRALSAAAAMSHGQYDKVRSHNVGESRRASLEARPKSLIVSCLAVVRKRGFEHTGRFKSSQNGRKSRE